MTTQKVSAAECIRRAIEVNKSYGLDARKITISRYFHCRLIAEYRQACPLEKDLPDRIHGLPLEIDQSYSDGQFSIESLDMRNRSPA